MTKILFVCNGNKRGNGNDVQDSPAMVHFFATFTIGWLRIVKVNALELLFK